MNIKFKNKRRGFTIVELVIVIAIIGILSAILIPTFANLINKANISSDQSMVKTLNTALAMDNAENGKYETVHKTFESLDKNYGHNVATIATKSNGELVYDFEKNQFVLDMGNGEYFPEASYKNEELYKLWKVYTGTDEIKGETYSIYLANKDYSGNVYVSAGFDAGNNTSIQKIEYTNVVTDVKDAQEVIIRTNGGKLSVNAPLDTIYHYEKADLVEVIATAQHSYHEFGEIQKIVVNEGHIVVESTGSVNIIDASNATATVSIDSVDTNNISNIITNEKTTISSNLTEKKVDKVEVSNEAEMKEALDNNEKYILVVADFTITSPIMVHSDTIIDGNNHKITSVADISSNSRGIRVDGNNAKVSILNLEIYGGQRGVQVDDVTGVKLYIDHCNISCTYYGINIFNGADVDLLITNTTVTGWGALNLWSAQYSVKVVNCILEGINDKGYNKAGWNGFGTIVLEGDTTNKTNDHSSVIDVEIINTTIKAKSTTGNIQKAILFNSQSVGNNVSLIGCTIELDNSGNTLLCEDNGEANTLIINGETIDMEEQYYSYFCNKYDNACLMAYKSGDYIYGYEEELEIALIDSNIIEVVLYENAILSSTISTPNDPVYTDKNDIKVIYLSLNGFTITAIDNSTIIIGTNATIVTDSSTSIKHIFSAPSGYEVTENLVEGKYIYTVTANEVQ